MLSVQVRLDGFQMDKVTSGQTRYHSSEQYIYPKHIRVKILHDFHSLKLPLKFR